jgi:sugar (pentulose or hexulose) kinase
MTYEGKPVKASRLFAGYEHEQQTTRISEHFNQDVVKYRYMPFNPEIIGKLQKKNKTSKNIKPDENILKNSLFANRPLSDFISDEEAYHQLIMDIITQQYFSTQLVLKGTKAKRIFVDGGFSKNEIYMNLLAALFPGMEIYAASMAQATAVGAALCIHNAWNTKPFPNDLIELKYYSFTPA